MQTNNVVQGDKGRHVAVSQSALGGATRVADRAGIQGHSRGRGGINIGGGRGRATILRTGAGGGARRVASRLMRVSRQVGDLQGDRFRAARLAGDILISDLGAQGNRSSPPQIGQFKSLYTVTTIGGAQ